ncbi:hypothetical protein O181_023718 [Austropuccinia psidii MF-1]|uniref:Uncharacterized protein n=1 Tax=Austropuccinia psidii MF-1 TaxID=1389203 RepID=A0A9Q3CJC3_9BASI|nr:hypothetical protein [Austropuccinia psidii MF-1]
MSPAYLRDLGFQRNQPEDREGLSRTRRHGRGHLRHSDGWRNNERDNIILAIHTPIQQEPQTRGLERHGSNSSAPPTPQRLISMEHGQQEVQPSISLGRTWSKFPEDLSQRDRLQGPYGNHQRLESYQAVQTPGGKGKQDKGESSHYPSYRRTVNPDRAYSDSFRLTRSKPNKLSSGFKLFKNQQISDQQSPFFTIPGGFQEERRIQREKQDLFQPKEERVRPKDPEIVGFGERSAQEPEVVVNHSRISHPINRNITPTQIEHNFVSPEINLNSDALWLQMSQYAEKTQKQFAELEASHERMKKLTASMDKIVKMLQEGHAQLSKASEETNKRLNIVFEEHHRKRDRDCLDQDIKKLFNVYHNMKLQPQGHVMDNPYQPDDIKPDSMLMNKARSLSQYQDGDGEYDHMELIDYINGLLIDLPSIPDYWITARLNTAFEGHASIWYTEMKEIHGRRNWPLWKGQIIQKYSNGTWIWKNTMTFENDKYSVENDPYEWCLRQSKRLKAIDPQMNIQMRNHKLLTQMPRELEHALKCRCNQNCTLDDIANTLQDIRKRTNIGKFTPYKSNHYANNYPKAKKEFYAIEKVPEEESPTEDSESDSMGDATREQFDDDQDPREEFIVEYQEETPLEIQDVQLEAGMP